CLIGFECDEGVRRNQGRAGAAKGPIAIREQLANIPYMLEESVVVKDTGNYVCTDGNLEAAQQELGNAVQSVLEKNYRPIILGGGHETFYGHYLGVRQAIGQDKSI